MASTSSSIQPLWDDDPFAFSNHLPSLEFEIDVETQSPLDWNNYLPFEQETSFWEVGPTNPNNISMDPLCSILDCQSDFTTPISIQEGMEEIQAYCSNGPGPLEEMGPMDDVEEAAAAVTVAVLCNNAEPVAKRPWRESRDGVGNATSRSLSKKEISRYFYMPITQAAKELNVGLTLLKKRCRELGIRRWPHRKLMSLQTLIKNVQEMGGESRSCAGKTNVVVEILDQERKLLEEVPDVQLEEKTKRLRQACFKANYKKRKLSGTAVAYPISSCPTPSRDSVFDLDTVFGFDPVVVGAMRW